MREKLTDKTFKERVIKSEKNIEILSQYTALEEEVKFKCNQCENIYNRKAKYILYHKYVCPECSKVNKKKKNLSNEDFLERVYEKNSNIKCYTKYINQNTKIKTKCLKCEHIWNPVANSLLNGYGCPVCAVSKRRKEQQKTHEQYEQEVKELYSGRFIPTTQYTGAYDKITIKCTICNSCYEKNKARDILDGKMKCGCIDEKGRMTHRAFLYRLSQLDNCKRVEVVGEFKGFRSKVDIKCKNCNREIKAFPKSIIESPYGGCKYCGNSYGSVKVLEFLKDKDIHFDMEYKFDDLKMNGKHLRFDFAVFKDEKLELLIEYDGEYHYKNIIGIDSLRKQQRYDQIKNDYCLKNNIRLLRIPYWEFENIQTILSKNMPIPR